jgi:glycerol-3-phosphate dehydrogenase
MSDAPRRVAGDATNADDGLVRPVATRADRLARLAGESFDVLVVGGGITGAGIARDAAMRGLRTALVERDDFASGTSSRSSRLVHGGVRYLEHGHLHLVFESSRERRALMRIAPHLVRPLRFTWPVYRGARISLWKLSAGLFMYDALAVFRNVQNHRALSARDVLGQEPALRRDGLVGGAEYFDAATDDARLTLSNVLAAEQHGAVVMNHVAVVRLVREAGRIVGAVMREEGHDGDVTVRANVVVNATGPWTDALRAMDAVERHQAVRATKGVHIAVPRERLATHGALTLLSPVDGRVMFALPWRDRSVLGTTDTDFAGTADEVAADAADVKYLCESGNGYFPGANLTPDDVIATWAGLRPLIAAPPNVDESEISREHEVFTKNDGLVIIAGGKLTTYRRMARETVSKTLELLRDMGEAIEVKHVNTKQRPLPGAEGVDPADLEGVAAIGRRLMTEYGLDVDTATHLCGVYGARAIVLGAAIAKDRSLAERLDPELPYVWAEIDFAAKHDLARTVEDVLARRVPLLLTSRDQGLGICDRVAARLAQIHGWDATVVAQMIDEYKAEVELSRRWRTG